MNLFQESNRGWRNKSISEKLTDIALEQKMLLASNKGYVIAPQKIIRCFRLSDLEVRVLLDLMSLMGEKDYAFAGHKYLTFHLGKKSTTSIKNALNSLKKKQFIYWNKKGGDLGTNHYWLKNLYYNPYIIMSEATHYCVNKILEIYRNEIAYEDLYGAVLDFIEPKKSKEDVAIDMYSTFLQQLADNPEDRDCPNLYITYCDRLSDHIENKTGFSIDILWDKHFIDLFEEKIPYKNAEENNVVPLFEISPKIMQRVNIIEEKFGYALFEEALVVDTTKNQTDMFASEWNRFNKIATNYVNAFGDSLDENQKCLIRGKFITNKILNQLTDNECLS